MKAPSRTCLKCGKPGHWGPCEPGIERPSAAAAKIIAGLRDAVAHARGDDAAVVSPDARRSLAPPGQCEFCDYRRAASARSMKKKRGGE